MKSPIALFCYARPQHTKKTVESLKANIDSELHDLIIFSDGPKNHNLERAVAETRKYIKTIDGFKSVKIIEHEANCGLSKSIIGGVSNILADSETVIVLEDDMVTSKYFLKYMNDALMRYRQDDRVISIHGYVYPIQDLPHSFFLIGADCWGWATWKRGWAYFNENGSELLEQIISQKRLLEFDFNGTYPYSRMLRQQIKGKNDSWAIRWYASAFLAGKFTLYPGNSLVKNIGNDNSGTHSLSSKIMDVNLLSKPIVLNDLEVADSLYARRKFQEFFRQTRRLSFSKILSIIRKKIS
jgi:hypothetical protein